MPNMTWANNIKLFEHQLIIIDTKYASSKASTSNDTIHVQCGITRKWTALAWNSWNERQVPSAIWAPNINNSHNHSVIQMVFPGRTSGQGPKILHANNNIEKINNKVLLECARGWKQWIVRARLDFVGGKRISELECVGPENWCVEHPLPQQFPVVKLINEHIGKEVKKVFDVFIWNSEENISRKHKQKYINHT